MLAEIVKFLRNKRIVFVPSVTIFKPGKKFDSGRFGLGAR